MAARKILGGKRTGVGNVLVNSPFSSFYIGENKEDKIMEDVGMVVTANTVSGAIKDPKCKELQDGEEKWHHGAVGPR